MSRRAAGFADVSAAIGVGEQGLHCGCSHERFDSELIGIFNHLDRAKRQTIRDDVC